MGKASRRKRQAQGQGTKTDPEQQRAPFVARPFEGLADETEWVAMREIVPAATAPVTLTLPDGNPQQVTLTTVLPGAMPALHRADGEILVACQARTSSGDASRDIAQAVIAAVAAEPGTPLTSVRPATMGTPRLQDLIDDQGLTPTVHEDFSFWMDQDEVTPEAAAALEQTNEAAVPTVKIEELPSAYWCKMGGRTYIRWILPDDEDIAVVALARLQAAGEHTLGDDTELLGAFRAAGLLVPVLEVSPDTEASDHVEALLALQGRYAEALGQDDPLTPQERRAREGLISRQVTLR
ncbi:MAG: DUF5926 family protein [Ornithinimicrobium sp.]|uniref:DUF5926 family protein n=1 Tax=Ornithinimicrobium sp. TaxID=1977084 RepID=UPI003D9B9931